jgi:hypothetical protein
LNSNPFTNPVPVCHIVLTTSFDEVTSHLCQELVEANHLVICHVDAKSAYKTPPKELIQHPFFILSEMNVSVYHGDFSIVEAIINCFQQCRYALDDNSYINVLSGQDFPTMPLSNLDYFLGLNPGLDFMNIVDESEFDQSYNPSNNASFQNGCHWINKKNPTLYYDHIRTTNYRGIGSEVSILQRRLLWFEKLKWVDSVYKKLRSFRTFNNFVNVTRRLRSRPEGDFYFGSAWFTIRKVSMAKMVDHLLHPSQENVLRTLRKMRYPDEITFQTLYVRVLGYDHLINSDLRYINWNSTDENNRPQLLSKAEISDLPHSNAFFCRKVNSDLIRMIKNSAAWIQE